MTFPKITIVSPSFNQERFLERTILSVLDQNYPNLEYIICDGGSTDGSVDIIKKYESKLAWWCCEPDKGQTDAINKGMSKATGDIVCWINSDDILLPGALNEIALLAEHNPDCDVFMGLTIRFDAEDQIMSFNIIPPPKPFFYHNGVLSFAQPSWSWRRSIFDKVGFLNEERHACMDIDFFMRQLRANLKVAFTSKHLAAIRIYEGTKTSGDDKSVNSIWEIDRKVMKKDFSDFHYKNERTWVRILFRFYKALNGMYCKQWRLTKKYKGKHISCFTD